MDKEKELDIFARTLYGEARGEGLLGLEAVANVILNRVKLAKEKRVTWWGDTISEVCLKPFQFSCWNANDVNNRIIRQVDEKDAVFRLCQRIARRAAGGFLTDLTKGATHYHAKVVNPKWALRQIPIFEYKNHLFYREVA